MPNMFHTQLDLELLAVKLEEMGFTRNDPGPRRESIVASEPPWNDAQPSDETDPWAEDQPTRQSRPARSSAPSKSNSRPARPSRPAAPKRVEQVWPDDGTEIDRFDRTWYFGEADAPECEHGFVAAMVDGESQAGKPYRVWACPAGFGKNYKSKCDLWDYVKN